MRFHAYWQSVTENEVFMIIKLDLTSNAVSPFWIIFFFLSRARRLSQQVLIYYLVFLLTDTMTGSGVVTPAPFGLPVMTDFPLRF